MNQVSFLTQNTPSSLLKQTKNILYPTGIAYAMETPYARQGGVLSQTKETAQYGRSTSNYEHARNATLGYMFNMPKSLLLL